MVRGGERVRMRGGVRGRSRERGRGRVRGRERVQSCFFQKFHEHVLC